MPRRSSSGTTWLHAERPAPRAANVACLDYSVVKGDMLAAYRWDGARIVRGPIRIYPGPVIPVGYFV